MRLSRSPHLDALCGEYLLGTLRGPARQRFERALREEPLVASRLLSWQNVAIPRPATSQRMQPDAQLWQRIARDVNLKNYRTPWYARLGLWRGWSVAVTLSLVVWIGVTLQPQPEPHMVDVAVLTSDQGAGGVQVSMSPDHQWMAMKTSRPVQLASSQSFEVWLLTKDGAPAQSMVVLAQLDGRVEVPEPLRARITRGDQIAVSVEPLGGSPSGAPTGPVILIGTIAPS